jgi:hypothetical protein
MNIQFSKLLTLLTGTFLFLLFNSAPAVAGLFDQGFAGIMDNIVTSVDRVPGLVAGISYLLGIGFGVKAILKLREHVENPSNAPLRMPVIHGLVGGGFLALPTILSAMINTIDPSGASFSPAIETVTETSGVLGIASALAGLNNFNQIFTNLIYALSNTPLLIYAVAYLAGIIMAVSALFKLKEHVEDANRVPLKTVVIRFLIGGALLTIPTIFNAMANTISPTYEVYGFIELIAGIVNVVDFFNVSTPASGSDANQIFSNILGSTSGFPTLISSLAYFLGLVIGISALFKLKEHVEDENRTPLREGVVRLIVGGALLALPVVFASMYHAISGLGDLIDIFNDDGATETAAACATDGNGLGNLICTIFYSTRSFPFFLTVIAYFAGTAFGIWSILQLQEHVINPQQTKFWDPFSKMLVAGGLFSLPTIVTVAANSVSGNISDHANSGFNDAGSAGSSGLDGMLANLMSETFAPMMTLINWFGVLAGFILIFIGITRLMKSAQEGPKGPGGLGTIMTFIAGGALISFSPMVASLTASLFTDSVSQTYASLTYTGGMGDSAIAKSNVVIASIFRFVFLLGLISIMRGIFIMRGVAEGNSQASMMAGMTHMIGGAMAVNLGGFLQAMQSTLGITAYGLSFGAG